MFTQGIASNCFAAGASLRKGLKLDKKLKNLLKTPYWRRKDLECVKRGIFITYFANVIAALTEDYGLLNSNILISSNNKWVGTRKRDLMVFWFVILQMRMSSNLFDVYFTLFGLQTCVFVVFFFFFFFFFCLFVLFLPEASLRSQFYVCEQQSAQIRLSICWSPMW